MIWFLTFLPEEKNVMSTWMYSLDLERHKDSFWGRDLADKPTVQAANCHFGCLSSNLDVAKGLDDFWPTRKRHSKTALECLPVVKDPFLLGVPMPHNGASNACKSCDLCLTSSEVFKPLQAFWTLLLNFGLRSVFRKQSNNIKGATAFVHHLLDAQHVFPSLKNTFVWGGLLRNKPEKMRFLLHKTTKWNSENSAPFLLQAWRVGREPRGPPLRSLTKGPAELPRFEACGNRIGKIWKEWLYRAGLECQCQPGIDQNLDS